MGEKAAVIGLGQSGQGAARLLQRLGWQVTLWDQGDTPALKALALPLQDQGITVRLGANPDLDCSRLVLSPGVPWDAPLIAVARQKGITVQGETDLAWESLADIPWVGVTGTNGKTTTTALIAAIWQAHGWIAPACGNIGLPVSEVALGPTPDWVIAELSSFQLEQSGQISPQIALWTTFSPDHLNRHGTLERYSAIKASLLDRAKITVLNGDDPHLRSLFPRWPQTLWISTSDPEAPVGVQAGHLWGHGQKILPLTELQLPGQHNLQNILMAVACAQAAGIPTATIAQAVRDFKGVAHRLETLGTLEGVAFINDSKATNYEASIVALQAMSQPVILLAGGRKKEGSPEAWLQEVQRKALAVVLYGEAGPIFAEYLSDFGYNAFQVCTTLDEAVTLAWSQVTAQGAVPILLSPACASYDQFANFEARGNRFRQIFEAMGT